MFIYDFYFFYVSLWIMCAKIFLHVYDPTLHRRFLRIRLLEHNFDYITYFHVPRSLNQITDTLANHILDWHLSHT